VLAALRAGIATVMLPARNEKELEEIPEDARRQLQFVWLNNVTEAVQFALVKPAARPTGDTEPAAQPALPRFPAEHDGSTPPVARH
jgi:ATP-dependent Lon protease